MNKELENNSMISHYCIVSKIGKGGMGEVYLAEDTKLDRKVALKILPAEFAEDADRMSRFVREAKSASALNHPNIITIYEIGEFENTHYIATEFIDGKTLNDYAIDNPSNYRAVLDIAIQVASALDEAHAAGIVHRDIKPDNVMVRENGLAKILDFGIAKLTENETPEVDSEDATAIHQPSTSPGMIIGTATYMSPEQARGEVVDTRTDIFSFGVVLYEMIAGHLPFKGKTPMEIIAAIIHKEPKPLDTNDVASEIEEIISKTLRKDRNERYQTIKELLEDLKDVKQELEFQDKLEKTASPNGAEQKTQMLKATTVDELNQTTTNDSVSIKKSSFNKFAVGVLAILFISAIGLGYWLYSGNSSKQIESIAVMPFVNESGSEDVEYLSDGMTETLISSLSNLPNLNVKPRSTVFRYKGKETNPQTIAKELNVQAILNGRVVQRGQDISLFIELIDISLDKVIWSESYNRKQSDLVTLQSDIARDVSGKIKTKLSSADEAKVTKTYTANAEAYELYLKGRYYWNKRTLENIRKSIKEFKAAVDKDPNYALAYVGLADSYVVLPFYGIPSEEVLPEAKNYAQRALEIDDSLSETQTSMAFINTNLWNWVEAEKGYKRAIELNPNYSHAHKWYGDHLGNLGRIKESLKKHKRAQELEPMSLIVILNVAERHLALGDPKSAFEESQLAIDLDPNWYFVKQLRGLIFLRQGRNTEAISEAEKSVELSDRQSWTLGVLGYIYAETGNRSKAEAILQELEDKYAKREAMGHDIARVHVGLGDKEQAFRWLEKDFQSRNSTMAFWLYQVPLNSLRDEPRFKDLVKRMGMPE